MIEFEARLLTAGRKTGTQSNPGATFRAVLVFDDPDTAAAMMRIGENVRVELVEYQPPLQRDDGHPRPMDQELARTTTVDSSGVVVDTHVEQPSLNGTPAAQELAPRAGRRRGTRAARVEDGP